MKKNNKKAFSIIEILVWIMIFLFWITAIFWTINSTMWLNNTNKYYIIWVNLAREQLELFRNLRDTNFVRQKWFDNLDSDKECLWDCEKFEVWKFYKISNDFSGNYFVVKVKESKKVSKPYNAKNTDLKEYQVCLDKNWFYSYCSDIVWEKKELEIYKFIEISKVDNYKMNWVSINWELDLKDWLKVTSKVVWYSKRWQEFEVDSIFTNYKN